MATAPTAPAAAAKETKTPLEKLLTSTPVLMTIIATVLAGMSSSFLTRSQYERSRAAQSQSKVSDEWALFQARRIRATVLENTVDLLQSQLDTARIDAASLRRYPEELPTRLTQLAEDAGRALQLARTAEGELGSAYAPLTSELTAFQKSAQAAVKTADEAKKKIIKILDSEKGKQAMEFLGSDKLPEARDEKRDEAFSELNKTLGPIVKMIEDNKKESLIESEIARIKPNQLQEAMDLAAEQAAAFDNVCKPINNTYRDLDREISRQRELLRPLYQEARESVQVVIQVPAGTGKPLADVQQACQNLFNSVTRLRAAFQETANDFKASRLDYNARRYTREARFNQVVAGLHEIVVRKDGMASDDLRTRSKYFFYAMLAAQGGVTIATFSLALRQKGLLLALAYTAGVTALSIAIAVLVF
jgi:hypothetical protein